MSPRIAIASLLLLAVATTGCFTRSVRNPVFKEGRVQSFTRGEVRGSTKIDRGYEHPAAISSVRLAHILSRIDLRYKKSGGFLTKRKDTPKRVPVIDLEVLYPMADALAQGLAAADSSEVVVVQAITNEHTLFIFDKDSLTNFLAYIEDDLLYIHFGYWAWQIPPRREKRLPEPHIGEHPLKFKILPSEGMVLVDSQSVAVEWRDALFKQPTRTRVTPSGRVVRKTVLMEMDVPAEEIGDQGAPAPLPRNLTPDQLRRLADLEEVRRGGSITEEEYRKRRRDIIDPDRGPDELLPGEGVVVDTTADDETE